MYNALLELGLFTAKAGIILLFILIVLIAFFTLLAKGKEKFKGKLIVKNLNRKIAEYTDDLMAETLSKKSYKQFLKSKKSEEKNKDKRDKTGQNIFVINFHGDIKASAVSSLREVVTAILNVATTQDEVVVKVESAGGMVNGYGLAAAQLTRFRDRQIPLTVIIDKVAASGGYLMASVANKILAAPFSIIGSIGVIVQLPNFHRLLKEKHVDFEQHTAGEFKRTITMFGQNTQEGRQKLQEEIEEIHHLFKNLITEYRKEIDIQKVSTGEYWLGQQALGLKLVDGIMTSDDYLYERSKIANVYELSYEIKKPMLGRLSSAASLAWHKLTAGNSQSEIMM